MELKIKNMTINVRFIGVSFFQVALTKLARDLQIHITSKNLFELKKTSGNTFQCFRLVGAEGFEPPTLCL